ncbi:MAG TPA: hypothetical protein VKB80_21890 [Kofleriaceae bacterium]|nr:hypothetical protein [Kofleriaceae bacterium]
MLTDSLADSRFLGCHVSVSARTGRVSGSSSPAADDQAPTPTSRVA